MNSLKVLVTGSGGFIGKNLICRLNHADGIEAIPFDVGDDFKIIEDQISEFDFIFHLAGINRPDDAKEFYLGNTDFTLSIVELIKSKGLKIPFVFSSSVQAALDNDYGKSKKLAEDALLSLGEDYPIFVYRLANVFGKWCRPNYNSVVATFCHNIMRGLPIQISDSRNELNLIYVDDVVDEFINVLKGDSPSYREGKYCHVNPVYSITLGELAETLHGFKEILKSEYLPSVEDDFSKKLFSTFVSYGTQDDFVFSPKVNSDQRGSFIELLKSEKGGQVSVSVSKKGVTRGNHYHDTKMEKFIVIKGEARITLRHLGNDEMLVFDVDGECMQEVTIPVGYTHNIENLGDELILLIWVNEEFDNEKPDTYAESV